MQAIVAIAAIVVVVAGFKAAAELIVPVLVALFLSLLSLPPMRRLERLGVPSIVAIFVVVTVATLLVLSISAVVGRSVARFQSELPTYQNRLDAMFSGAMAWLEGRGVRVDVAKLVSNLDSASIMRLVGDTASGLLAALSNVLLVVITMVFMLVEAQGVSRKLRAAMGDPDADLSSFTRATETVQKYLAIKAAVSLATGALITILCLIVGVDFPFLWGLIAFLFNFVPNIGSIIAAIPTVLLALIQLGPVEALLVALGFVVINMVIGNGIEPRLMGRRLGLSTLVVFLSMLFWGWIWGPMGMLLSVPLTVILRILLEHSDDFRWLSVLLGSGDDLSPKPSQPPEQLAPEQLAPDS
ncbi:MAG: AI-2E family transporter [Haliangiales bacterium]